VAAEQEIEADRGRHEVWQQQGEGEGAQEEHALEDAAMLIVEEVARLELFVQIGVEGNVVSVVLEEAGVEQAIGCVEHPDGDRHGEDGGRGEADVVTGGEKPGPERGYAGRVQGEQVPKADRLQGDPGGR
jgi:hypothetical protein